MHGRAMGELALFLCSLLCTLLVRAHDDGSLKVLAQAKLLRHRLLLLPHGHLMTSGALVQATLQAGVPSFQW